MIERPSFSELVAMLRASLHRGTPRPHPTSQGMSEERRAVLDAQARIEFFERAAVAPGEHPAPMHLDVLDLLDEAGRWGDDPDREADWWRRALSALGLVIDGQLLDAECPWCSGRTRDKPVGGERTLRVRLIVDRKDRDLAKREHRDVHRLPVIVCEGLNCDPPSQDASEDERWHGHPTWLQGDWEWLAARIVHADSQRAAAEQQIQHMLEVEVDHAGRVCRCGSAIAATGRGGQQPGYCSDRCRRDADATRKRRRSSASAA